jgi:hypothetical protein
MQADTEGLEIVVEEENEEALDFSSYQAAYVEEEEIAGQTVISQTAKTSEENVSDMLMQCGNATDAGISHLWMRSTTSFERCYGDQLTGPTREIYDAMVNAWGTGKTDDITIDFTKKYTFEAKLEDWKKDHDSCEEYEYIHLAIGNAVQTAYDAFAYDYPEVFWLSTVKYVNRVKVKSDDEMVNGVFTKLILHGVARYPSAKSEIPEFQKAVAAAVKQIRKTAASDSEYAIVRAIHDYICETTVYGENTSLTEDLVHTAAGVFLQDHTAVCEGYAKAFKILCNQFDIPCVLIVGYADGAHMWNYVRMDDGKWYLVDTTWDDHDEGIKYNYFLAGSKSFGFDDRTISNERVAYTDFSSTNLKSFILPSLSSTAYQEQEHTWNKISWTAGTCRSYEKIVYQCSSCSLKKTEFLSETDHMWGQYTSNNDATCLKDGTKTAKCIYGCGTTHTIKDSGSKLKGTITLNAENVTLQVGQSTSKIQASGLGKGDSIVSWKSSSSSVVSVTKNGKLGATLKAKKAGTAKITVKLKSGTTKTIKVKVKNKKVTTKSLRGIPSSLKLKKGKKTSLSVVTVPSNSQEKVTYTSSNTKIVTVSAKGVVKAKKKGTAYITVRSGKCKKKCKVTVK